MADDIIETALKKLEKDQDHWQEVYEKAREDSHFLSDDEYAQWDETDYLERKDTNRPALTIDQLGQFVHQVVNDIRINTPTINVIPTGYESDQKTAEVFKGIIKNIEYASGADDVYDYAVLNAVKTSIGFIRIDHDYEDDESFNQSLCIKRVINPLAVFLDSNSIEVDGRDAKHATILDRMTAGEFKAQWPDKDAVPFRTEDRNICEKDDDEIIVAEHFVIEETEKTIAIDDMGNVSEYVEGMPVKRTRKVKNRRVMRYKLSGQDVLEETVFPGKYIPIIPVYGEENWIEGKRNLLSLIRKSKHAQRMFNYWKSLETELLMKAPQAPIMAAEGQTEDYAADWLHPSKAAVLRYKTTDAQGNPVGAPQRLEPPTIPTGIVNASRATVDDIKATMGIYNASLGQRSNEQSGVAIAQRKQEGDVATFHYADNLNKSICHAGRILVCAIPEVIDTARILTIIGMEEEVKKVGVNGEMAEDQDATIDLRKGKYDVKVVPGASYTTLRQEAAAALQGVFQASPELMTVMGDLYFKNSDFAGAQAMAERMKKVIDPKFLSEEDKEEMAKEGGQVIDPEKEQMGQLIQQGMQEIQTLTAQIEQKDKENQMLKAMNDLKAQYDALKAQEQISTLKIANQEKDLQIMFLSKEAQMKEEQDQMETEVIDGIMQGGQMPMPMGEGIED